MNWGKSIILSFVVFAVFIGVLVFICVKQEVSLVSKNYYQEELDYQQRIELMNNYNQLSDKPEINISDRSILIQFDSTKKIGEGTFVMFRPSDGKMDQKFVFQASKNIQDFDVSQLARGLYHLKMEWSMNNKGYFLEKTITL